MQTERQQLGNWGEDKAVECLKGKKYKILDRNWRNKWGEIDIVAKDKESGTIVFVEVKTIYQNPSFHPLDQVNPKKQRQLAKMAQLYLAKHKLSLDIPCQIDIITVERQDENNCRIEHFENTIEDTR